MTYHFDIMRSKNALFLLTFFICLIGGIVLSLYCGNEGKVVVWWSKFLFGSFIYICYLCIVDLRERGCEGSKTEKFIWRCQ